MSINSSTFANLSSSNSSLQSLTSSCFQSEASIVVFSAFFTTNLLLLPFFILVFYLVYQQWRQYCSSSTTATGHSDLFTYHSIAMQPFVYLGFTCFFCGGYFNISKLTAAGLSFWSVASFGQALFHILTCVERYLAVVHPITYLGLRTAAGVRIRNITIGCVWLLSSGWMAALYQTGTNLNLIMYCSSTIVFLVVMSFLSISVLCALKRPGPGEVGGKRERVDQSKQTAFQTILAIMGVLLLRFGGNLIGFMMLISAVLKPSNLCMVYFFVFWLDLPSTLVLPLVFLQRTGRLQCCKQTPESA